MEDMKARFKNKASIDELIKFEDEFALPTLDMKEPVKKEKIKPTYYSAKKNNNKDSATGLF